MKKLIWVALILTACNQNSPRQDEDYRYEITFTFGVIGYPYQCDSYSKFGNTYKLYRGKKLFKTFEAGSNVLVSVEARY